MNKKQTIEFLKKEIRKINVKIDHKIILGEDWTKERQKHLRLLNAIRELTNSIYA